MTRAALRPVPERAPRAILYLRQSISRDDSVSLELQETACRDHAARNGYEVVRVVSDPNRSGKSLKRRKVQEVIDALDRREADIVVLWRWTRLSRSRKDFAVTCDTIEALGGRLESATEPIDTRTPSGRFARGVMAEYAAYESELKGEVWKEIHARRRGLGTPAQGGQRFGYLHEKGSNRYEVDPVTGPILAELYRRNIAGEGCRRLAIWLNDHDIRTTTGHLWSTLTVRRLLISGFGAGKLVQDPRSSRTRTYLPGAHPAVITDKEWLAFQRRIAANARPDVTNEARYMLSGLMVCDDCGKRMHAQKMGKEAGYGYVCSTWMTSKLCRCVTVTRSRAEAAVYAFLVDLATDIDAASRRAELAGEKRVIARATAKDLARRITQADERLNRLTSGWTEGLVPESAYRATRDEILEVKNRLLRELAVAEDTVDTVPVRPSLPAGILDVWHRMPPERQRAVLKPLIDRVLVIRPAERRGRQSRNTIRIVSTWGETYTAE